MKEAIEIKISHTKLAFFLVLAAAFIIAGIFFLIQPENFVSSIQQSEQLIRIIGIIAVIFFGACFIWILRRFFDDEVGLRIDETGITDNSSGVSVGLINWEDISGIETYQIHSTKFIVLLTDQPDKYIQKARTGLMKKAMQANKSMCGSPLTINSNSLKIKHAELEELIYDQWDKYGNKDFY
ncbi:MAG: STM3941 family protein [Nitrososphaeraceae archaeon]|nr:STM3941 family protein [Nitrososphaeraceae archaeon]